MDEKERLAELIGRIDEDDLVDFRRTVNGFDHAVKLAKAGDPVARTTLVAFMQALEDARACMKAVPGPIIARGGLKSRVQ